MNKTIISKDEDQVKAYRKVEESVKQLTQLADDRDAKFQGNIIQLNKSVELKIEEASQKSKLEIGQKINQLQNNITEQ